MKKSLNNLTKKGTFLSEETLEMFLWMQKFNKTHVSKPIVVCGADAQNWTTLISSLDYLGKNVPYYAKETTRMATIKYTSDKKLRRLEGLVRFPAQFLQKLTLDYMGMLAQSKGPGFLEKVKSDKGFVALFDSKCRELVYICRDYSMATNIKFALEIEHRPGVYWSHNGHVARFFNHPEIVWPNPKPKTVQTVLNT